jgi:hypothetical protein
MFIALLPPLLPLIYNLLLFCNSYNDDGGDKMTVLCYIYDMVAH